MSEREREGWKLHMHVNLLLRVSLYKQWGLVTSKTVMLPLIADKHNVASQ